MENINTCNLVAVNFALHNEGENLLSAETSTTLFLNESDAIQYLRETFNNEVQMDAEGERDNETVISEDGTYAKITNYRRDGSVDISEWWVTTLLYQHQEASALRTAVPGGTLIAREKSKTGSDEDDSYPGFDISYLPENGTEEYLVAMVEHSDSEPVCGFDPSHPEIEARERSEVPESRIDPENPQHVLPGLICRAWERFMTDDFDKRIIFDYSQTKKEESKNGG